MAKGWIKLHREIKDHWIIKKPDYFAAWVIILLEVNYEKAKVLIGSELIELEAGESLNSLQTWADLFGKNWSIQKVRTFFSLLKKDSMINTIPLKKTTRLSVCKFGTYQFQQQDDNSLITSSQHPDNILITTNKKYKKEKNNNNSSNKEKILFDYDSGELSGITEKEMGFWEVAFPAVDIPLAIAQAKAWLQNNPTKRKKDIKRFLGNWFMRAQEKGGGSSPKASGQSSGVAGPKPLIGNNFKDEI